MKIKDLPEEIKQLAEKRMYEERGFVDNNINLKEAFFWEDTPEDGEFWSEIDNGNF